MKQRNPNQRNITIHKEPANGQNLYTTNDLTSVYEAMGNLTTNVGFKLYMYLASNKNNYNMNLSSSDFCQKAECGRTAYTSAFDELVEKKYLILKPETNTTYYFYDKARTEDFNITEEIEEEQKRKANKYKLLKIAVLEESECG